jgi:5-methylcytosine-specific restriction endonuclease McrA
MSKQDESDTLDRIFSRTEGRCHICRKQLCFSNYGQLGRRGAWEIEHSLPVSKGGTDHLNNLYAACVRCNRSKGNSSTRTARAEHGYNNAPVSKQQRTRNAVKGSAIGALAMLLVPPQFRLLAAIVGAATGAIVGHNSESK